MNESDSCRDAPTSDQSSQSATGTGPKPSTGDPTAERTTSMLLENLLEVATQNLPASQMNPKNRKHIASMEQVMRRYFRKLETAFPTGKVTALYNRHVED